MSRTYKATGINLKAQAFGESDRIVTILTREFGLIRAIATGARKHLSSLGGRSGMFVVNELLIAKGRSIDKITQAQTIKTYPGLGGDLGKLAASQYLAEIVIAQALSEYPQDELFELFNEHLNRLEKLPKNRSVLAYLVHGIFQLLALAGFKPQVEACCLTENRVIPDFSNPKALTAFSIDAGGVVSISAWENLRTIAEKRRRIEENNLLEVASVAKESGGVYSTQTESSSQIYETIIHEEELPPLLRRLSASELSLLQQLPQWSIIEETAIDEDWLYVERLLRQYAQYHFGRSIRSAALIDSFFVITHG
jgi:DNA repair protein RecO (recombination protein O)